MTIKTCGMGGALMNKLYAIYDWAGNKLGVHGRFDSFESAWEYIIGEMGLEDEEDIEEYEVRCEED